MVVARFVNHRQLKRSSLGSFPSMEDLEWEFGVSIVVLDTQRSRAIANRGRVYLSVGLIERLETDELRAVVAHEVYHLRTSPPRLLSFLLGLTSLTFLRYRDEGAADAYAASVAGPGAIIGALRHLDIKDAEERASALSAC
jgi:heat shock protein HtpX